MKLSKFKTYLNKITELNFESPNGELIPSHFHVTEVGSITKNFIDCGGTVRTEKVVNFQLWYSNDVDHRLVPQKLLDIIALSEQKLGIKDFDIEVEYQSDTIGKYDLDFNGNHFVLVAKQTACLAPDNCGIPVPETKTSAGFIDLTSESGSCTPGSGCC